MPPETFEQLLNRAAAAHGIEPEFWDIWGQRHITSVEAKQALLSAVGVPAGSREEIEEAVAAAARREWSRLVPPAVVAREGERHLVASVPTDCLGHTAQVEIRREDGEIVRRAAPLGEWPQAKSIEMDGVTWVHARVELPVALPLGYHDITVEVCGRSGSTRYIVTPERCWVEPHLGRGGRAAGIGIALYGLRSQRNWGCGDFRDLRELTDWAADELKIGFVGLNPLHAIHNRRPFNTSPYLPNCVYYQNYIYLDVEGMEDFAGCARAARLRRSEAVEKEIRDLRNSPFVEYERVSGLKLRFLKLAFARFLRERRKGSARAGELQAFCEREGDLLEKFATYCALDEALHRRNPDLWVWPDWPEEYRDPESAATAAFRRKHWRAVMFYQYLQWQIDVQLGAAQQAARQRRLAIGLYHDLALATDRFGSDLWAHRRFYVSGCRVGSPPDDFAPQGQDWGFPPPNSEVHRDNGYRMFVESIRKNCRHGGALRIDHVMRLFRLYWIPDGSNAAHGAYVRERTEDFVRILALESVRNRVLIVGEDLGTVEPEIRETLARFGVLSYRLFYFEKDAAGKFKRSDSYPAQALVASTTHDLPTLAGFWAGTDIAARRDAGMLDDAGFRSQTEARQEEKQKMLDVLFEQGLMPAEFPRSAAAYPEMTGDLHNAAIGFLATAPSALLAINQEDLTKELCQQNLPGTTWQYPNWGRKMRYSIEDLRNHGEARAYTAMIRNWVARTGRHNQPGE